MHTPDLYGGRAFDSIEAGAAFTHGPEAPDLDAPDVDALADAAVAHLPTDWSTSAAPLG